MAGTIIVAQSRNMSERFIRYPLPELLPEQSCLVLDQQLGVLTLLLWQEDGCTVAEQQLCPDQEREALVALFENYPDYTPLEQLIALRMGMSVDHARKLLHRAMQEGDTDAVMRPVRNIISRVRIRIRAFGIDIRSVLETGYLLFPDNGGRGHARHN